jgi:crotonobetainyl-CoA:carnitine CoA-transferase CaiB-like acyl-CoA transferase
MNAPEPDPTALRGVRILDFTRVLAGPFATKILADFGAEVIKVQSKKMARGSEANMGPHFNIWNRNKRSITLNMNYAEARKLALRLVAISDVVIENFSPRVMSNWGLNYDTLRAAKPDLIMASLSGMGQTGPWKNYVAFGATVQALGGLTYLTSYDKNTPMGPGYAYADAISGLYGALAVLGALDYRDRTGKGQFIDLSEYEAVVSLIGPALLETIASESELFPNGNQSDYEMAAPYGCFRCQGSDQWCVIAVFNEAQWQSLCSALLHPQGIDTKKFSSMSQRKKYAKELDERIEHLTSQYPAAKLVELLQAAGVPAGVIQNAEDLAQDSHLLARDYYIRLPHPELGETISDRSPIRFSEDVAKTWKAAPSLGEANPYVFIDLMGLTESEYASYVDRGIIA